MSRETATAIQTDPDPHGFGLELLKAMLDEKKRDAAIRLIAAPGTPLGIADKSSGNTALHIAASRSDAALVKLLLEKGADPLIKNKAGKIPIDLSCDTRDWQTLRSFAEAKLDNPSAYSNALLVVAADTSFPYEHLPSTYATASSVALALITAKASLKAVDKEGNTPLHCAASAGNFKLVNALLEAGADPYAKNAKGELPIESACKKEKWEVVAAFAARRPTDSTAYSNALVIATANTKSAYSWYGPVTASSAALALINAGTSLEAADKDGNRPLHLAAASANNSELVKALLEAGAKLSAENTAHEIPIEIACKRHHWKLVGVFATHSSADRGAYAGALWSATQQATLDTSGALEAALMLIKAGISLNSRDSEGNTPLHIAVANDHVALVKALLRAGADTSAANRAGLKPINMAPKSADSKIVDIFTQEIPITIAAFNGKTMAVTELLIADPRQLATKNSDGDSVIMAAAHQGHWETVNAIAHWANTVDKQLDPEEFGFALLNAAALNKCESVEALLKTNPSSYKDGTSGNGPVHYAIKHNNLPMLRALLDAGCLDDHTNSSDKTPLEYAKEAFSPDSRSECIAELTDATKREARTAARIRRYPDFPPLPSSEEIMSTLNARALELTKAEITRKAPDDQLIIIRGWQGLLTGTIFEHDFYDFTRHYMKSLPAKLAREFVAKRGIRPRHFKAVKFEHSKIPVEDIVSDELKYLIDIEAYKTKLLASQEVFVRICSEGGVKFTAVAKEITPLIDHYFTRIRERLLSFKELDYIAEERIEIENALRELVALVTKAENKVPLLDRGASWKLLTVLSALPKQIKTFTNEVNQRLSKLSALKSTAFKATHAPTATQELLNSLKKARTELLDSLALKSHDSHCLKELMIIDGRIAELEKLDTDLTILLSYYDQKESNSVQDQLVYRGSMAFQFGFICINDGASDYQESIKATLDDCARSAQQDHHRATLSLALFGTSSRLAILCSSITGTPLVGRSKARAESALEARATAGAGAGSKRLPSKDDDFSKAKRSSSSETTMAGAGASSRSGGADSTLFAETAKPSNPLEFDSAPPVGAPPADPVASPDASSINRGTAPPSTPPAIARFPSIYPLVPGTAGNLGRERAATADEENPGHVTHDEVGGVSTPRPR